MLTFLYGYLSLRYPALRGFLTFKQIQACAVQHYSSCHLSVKSLINDHCYTAEDYAEELDLWKDDVYCRKHSTVIQLPYEHMV
jgi:hypothetical protein